MTGHCKWTQNSDGYYETACSHIFILNGGTTGENQMTFCCYCGLLLVEVLHVELEDGEADAQ